MTFQTSLETSNKNNTIPRINFTSHLEVALCELSNPTPFQKLEKEKRISGKKEPKMWVSLLFPNVTTLKSRSYGIEIEIEWMRKKMLQTHEIKFLNTKLSRIKSLQFRKLEIGGKPEPENLI